MMPAEQHAFVLVPDPAPEAPLVTIPAPLAVGLDAALAEAIDVIADAMRGASGEIFSRAAHGALERARHTRASLLVSVDTVTLAAFAGRSRPAPPRISVTAVQHAVAHQFGVPVGVMTGRAPGMRGKGATEARHVAMWLCKSRLACSFPEIGRAFGDRDHTTCLAAVRKITALRASNPLLRAQIVAAEIEAFGRTQ